MAHPEARAAALAAALTLGFLATGCGGTANPHAAPTTSSTPAASSDVAAIKANWSAFFASSTSVARRVALLQDGSAFASLIRAESGSPLAKDVSAKVVKVTVSTPTSAKVVYSIVDDKIDVLRDKSGTALREDGTWKVGDSSFCGLLRLEYTGSSSSLPAACGSSG